MPRIQVFAFSLIELIDGIPHTFNGETHTPVPSVRILWRGRDRTVYCVGHRLISPPELLHTLANMDTHDPAWITSEMPKHALKLLQMLSEGHGIADIARTLGTSPTYLYRVLTDLQKEGVEAATSDNPLHTVKSFEEIKALLDEGRSVADVASTLKVSANYIYALIKKAGATPPKKRRTTDNMEQVRAMLAEGRNAYAIAKTLGISHQRVYQIAQKLDKPL